jgi:CheY-like chemotaxis protein
VVPRARQSSTGNSSDTRAISETGNSLCYQYVKQPTISLDLYDDTGIVSHAKQMDGDLTICVVDDAAGCRELYAEWLSGRYDVLTASDKETALDTVDADVDIVLLDRDLESDDERAIASALSEQKYSIHVVMVSWLEADFDIAAYPIDGYVEKPVTEDDLLEIVEQYEQQRGYQRALETYFSLSSKLAAIEAQQSAEQLSRNPEYDELKRCVEEKRQEVDEAITEGTADWNFAFNTCADLPGEKTAGDASE